MGTIARGAFNGSWLESTYSAAAMALERRCRGVIWSGIVQTSPLPAGTFCDLEPTEGTCACRSLSEGCVRLSCLALVIAEGASLIEARVFHRIDCKSTKQRQSGNHGPPKLMWVWSSRSKPLASIKYIEVIPILIHSSVQRPRRNTVGHTANEELIASRQ